MDRAVLFDALADDVSAEILRRTTDQARTVSELSEMIDASPSTIYRRLDRLADQGIVEEGLELDEDGNHRRTYRTALRRVDVEFRGGGIEVTVERREDEIDRFTRIWEDIRGEP